jgi:hypothetical protein
MSISGINSILSGRSTDAITRVGRAGGSDSSAERPIYIVLGDANPAPKSHYPDFSQLSATSLDGEASADNPLSIDSVFK